MSKPIDHATFRRLFPNASQSSIRLNSAMGAVEANQPKPTAAPALARRPQKRKGGKGGLECVITLCACIRRELDQGDNLPSSMKPLRDAIAASLGVDDGDVRVRWEYTQAVTRGAEGVMVKIERI